MPEVTQLPLAWREGDASALDQLIPLDCDLYVRLAGLPVDLQTVGPFGEHATPIRFPELLSERQGGFAPPPGYGA